MTLLGAFEAAHKIRSYCHKNGYMPQLPFHDAGAGARHPLFITDNAAMQSHLGVTLR